MVIGTAAVAVAVWILAAFTRRHSGPDDPRDFTQMQAMNLASAIDLYYVEEGSLPKTLKDLIVRSARSGGPFLAAEAPDGWHRPFEFSVLDPANGRYSIRSRGADGETRTSDDIYWERAAPSRRPR